MGVAQLRVGRPAMWTVQAPHRATPQPSLAPVSPMVSRTTYNGSFLHAYVEGLELAVEDEVDGCHANLALVLLYSSVLAPRGFSQREETRSDPTVQSPVNSSTVSRRSRQDHVPTYCRGPRHLATRNSCSAKRLDWYLSGGRKLCRR
jgi:hypothetical protein